jgi:TolA-binding protein
MPSKHLLSSIIFILVFTSPAYVQEPQEEPLVLRVNKLEQNARQQAGEIENLQHNLTKLQQQLEKFQEDTEFRLSDKKEIPSSSTAPKPSPTEPPEKESPPPKEQKKIDAFDPSKEPNAVGAPQPLGSPLSQAPPQPKKPLSTYAQAQEAFKEKAYDRAETLFFQALKDPISDQTDDALFYLGEIYFQKKNFRSSTEYFSRVIFEYKKSERIPEAIWKLGLSLKMLNKKEMACANFKRLKNQYPAVARQKGAALDEAVKEAECR